jgi:Vitamin K-dependent gamma-carboxylase
VSAKKRRRKARPAPTPSTEAPRAGSGWESYWHGPVAAVRPYLLLRGVLLLLAFDLWYLMMPHAGRYGASGFNVAHFAWLDAMAPMPSDGLYVGVLILAGLAAFAGAMTGERAAIVATLGLYTYGWAMSLLDGFQHHYLLSLFLLGFALVPALRAGDLGRRVTAWAYRLLAVTLAIVYVFASASKFEARWQGGGVLGSLARGKAPFGALEGIASGAGISPSTFWTLASLGVTTIEIVVAAGYLLCTRPEAEHRVRFRRLGWVAFACAVALHVEVEVLGLHVGWFSVYMLLAACVFFLPEAWLARAAGVLTWPSRRASTAASGWIDRPATAVVTALAAGGAWVAAGVALDMPGASRAGAVAALATAVFAALALARQKPRDGTRCALASGAAAALCVITITVSPVRFDFYRYLGGDLERRGELAASLAAYEKAEQYAPPSRSRRKKLDELRQRVAQPRP